MEPKREQQHLSVTVVQLELRTGVVLCVDDQSAQATGALALAPKPHIMANTIRQVLNGAFRLRRLDEPYPDEPSEVVEGNLRRLLVVLGDRRAAPDRRTVVRFVSRDGYSVSRIAASSEAMANRDLYPRHLRSIYLYAYNYDLERVREEIDSKLLPVLASARAWSEPR